MPHHLSYDELQLLLAIEHSKHGDACCWSTDINSQTSRPCTLSTKQIVGGLSGLAQKGLLISRGKPNRRFVQLTRLGRRIAAAPPRLKPNDPPWLIPGTETPQTRMSPAEYLASIGADPLPQYAADGPEPPTT